MNPAHLFRVLILFTGLVTGLVAVRQRQITEKHAAEVEPMASSDTFPCTGPGCPRAAVDVCGIPNFEWTIGNALARSGQPSDTSSTWTCLKNAGFDVIINQREPEGNYTVAIAQVSTTPPSLPTLHPSTLLTK